MAGRKRHGGRSKPHKRKVQSVQVGLSKKQKKHLKQYGEAHPMDERDDSRQVKYRKVEDRGEEAVKEESSSSDESETETPTAYQQLLSHLKMKRSKQGPLGGSSVETESSDSSEDEADDEVKEDSVEPEDEEENDKDKSGEESEGMDDEDDISDGDVGDTDKEGLSKDDYRDESYSTDEEGEGDTKSNVMVVKGSDPFVEHFETDIADALAESAKNKELWTEEEIKLPVLGKATFSKPGKSQECIADHKEKDLSKMHVKQSVCQQVNTANKESGQANLKDADGLTPLQHSLYSIIHKYQDLCYAERTCKNGEEIRVVYCLHALNHVLKTRSRVIAHNNKLKSKEDVSDEHRDQGLTRPKVLMVLPFRESALRVVNLLSVLVKGNDGSFVSNKKRFKKEFGHDDEEDKGRKKGYKPEDFEAIFSGNIDDHFRIGLGVAKKSLKLYTDFYGSDIILASPLGLRTIIGAEGEEKRDFDFLSSIEVLIFDQADIFCMQNWDHIWHLMNHIHLQPSEGHGVDFSRIRMWTLNGLSTYYRQTLIFSSLMCLEISALYHKHCHNYAGKVLISNDVSGGTVCQVIVQMPHVFHRIEAPNITELPDVKLEYFKTEVLPRHKDPVMSQTLVFVPSYFDYVCLRNYFKKEELNNVLICEYSGDKTISRSRNLFYHGKAQFMLYTERAHFYKRFRIRGVKHIIFYDLPLYPHFYRELCNMILDPKTRHKNDYVTCTVLYSKFDAYRLAAVVGLDRASRMVHSDQTVHMFVTGENT